MPRQKQRRKIFAPPNFSGFKPYGCAKECNGFVELFYEEYEAIKLADYDLLNYEEAAVLMGVSRATFARICDSARRKIARALVEDIEIKAVYGHALLNREWFLCNDCYARFDNEASLIEDFCPECKSTNISSLIPQHSGKTDKRRF